MKKLRAQFDLRMLLGFVGVVCVVSAWWGAKVQQKNRQEFAIRSLQTLNANIALDKNGGVVSINFPRDVDHQKIDFCKMDELLQDISRISKLQLHGAFVTDDTLKCINLGLANVDNLFLIHTNISPEGLKSLNTTGLKFLYLEGVDTAEEHLQSLSIVKSLRVIWLIKTSVSKDAILRFQRDNPKIEIITC